MGVRVFPLNAGWCHASKLAKGDESDDAEPIRLVKAVESIRRGKADRSEADVEIADKKQHAGGKR